MIGIAQQRPPFVEFKQVAIFDQKRSEEVGYRVTKDVDFAEIMQPGSRDKLVIKAVDWLAQIRLKMINATHDAFPIEWVDGFQKKFDMWKQGQEAPLNGTSVKEWPVLSPSQAQNFIALHIMTIEDVAEMTEEALQRSGMGSRDLREKAREWIKTSVMSKNAMVENEELKQQLADLQSQVAILMNKPKIGRPRKVA